MKLLIVKLSSLGDVVHALPAVCDLAAARPDAHIDWVVERGFAPLVARCTAVRRVIPMELRRWRRAPLAAPTRAAFGAFRAELQAEAYDRVLDLQGLTKSAWIAWLARLAPQGRRVALAHRTDGSGYEAPTRWVAHQTVAMPVHTGAVQRSRLLCAQALGYTPQGLPRCGLRVQPQGDAAEVVLVHASSRADKEWPHAHWLALAARLVAQGQRVGLPHGSDAEEARARALAAQIGPAATVWPRLALDALLDRMAGCAGVIGVDSGLSHIAVALDLPHVQLYNLDTAWRTGPEAPHQRAVFAQPVPPVELVWQTWLACRASRPDPV